MDNSIQCHLDDPAVPNGKVGFTRKARDEETYLELPCDVCGISLKFIEHPDYNILAVACMGCQQNWIPCVQYQPKSTVPNTNEGEKPINKVKDITCPKCGGLRKGRGYTHKSDCPSKSQKKELSICPECGGTKRGRGFSHKENCPILAKQNMPQARLKTSKGRRGRKPRI
jgi:hypothetical protein